MAEIQAEQTRNRWTPGIPGRPHVRRGGRWAGALVAGAILLALFAAALLPRPAALLPRLPAGQPATAQAAIEVRTVEGWYEIRIMELAEGTDQVEQELGRLGLDVTIDFVPVSPSLEGELVATAGGDGREEFVEPKQAADYTPVVRIPLDYQAKLALTIGRPGEPGENYLSSPALGAEAPGEELYKSGIFNMPVEDALRLLEERGFTAEWRDANNEVRGSEDLLGSYVVNTIPMSPGRFFIWTSPDPQVPDPRPSAVQKALAGE